MSVSVLFWDSDPILRTAVHRTLSWRGFRPLTLEEPSQLSTVIELAKPDLAILEGDWLKGTRISLENKKLISKANGVLSIILLSDGVIPSGDSTNQGFVVEKLRKPFGAADLASSIHSALGIKEQLEKRVLPWEDYLELRRLETEEEILKALKLRYEVYNEVGYLNSSDLDIDLDQYDRKSILLGAIIKHNGTRELVGSVRIIRSNSDGAHLQELEQIFRKYGTEDSSLPDTELNILPSFLSFGVTPEELSGYNPQLGTRFSKNGIEVSNEICELSRLVVKREYRRSLWGIERRLFELVVIDCNTERPPRNWFVISVHPSKSNKFERFGFREIPELGIKSYTGISQPAVLMALDLRHYLSTPNPFSKELDLDTIIYKVHGDIQRTLERPAFTAEKMAS